MLLHFQIIEGIWVSSNSVFLFWLKITDHGDLIIKEIPSNLITVKQLTVNV